MNTETSALSPPRAAAVAGVIFSILMGATLAIVRVSVPDDHTDAGAWLTDQSRRSAVQFAIQLAPFAGIAFLWFIGVLRNRLGELEDQFFATVFLGSGLLFVASLFASAALAGALLQVMTSAQGRAVDPDIYFVARQVVRSALNVFAIKMAGVFIMSTSTVMLRTRILPKWLALCGFGCAITLLLVITSWPWIAMVFPLWMLLVSGTILVGEFYPSHGRAVAGGESKSERLR
jgi:hypothetical protein